MRVLFLAMVVIAFEVCAFVMAWGVGWLVQPYWQNVRRRVMFIILLIAQLFLSSLLFGQFRVALGFLAVAWLVVLTVVVVCAVSWLAQKVKLNRQKWFVVGVRFLAVAVFAGFLGVSVYNAYTPVVRHISVHIDKPMAKPLRLAVASDLHLGTWIGEGQLQKMAQILRQEQVDIVLMPGDVMDDDTVVYDAQNMHDAMVKVVSATTSGAVASLGNHDLYKMEARSSIAQAIRATGTVLLDDRATVLEINGVPVSMIGRIDDHQTDRKTTAELIKQLPEAALENPVILLDHRPSQVEDNVKLPIDVQVSGHTHNGQVFPANLIVKAINRIAYGYEKINGTHIVVSSGFGFWGVPLRLGSQSEIWVIELNGQAPHNTP